MNRIQTRHSVMVASLIAAGLVFGGTSAAFAKDVSVSGNLNDVSGPVKTGNNAADFGMGRDTTAMLSFSVPSDAFGQDAVDLGNSSNSVDFSTQLMGSVSGLQTTLNASKTFDSGIELANFLLGKNMDFVAFPNASVKTAITGTSPVSDGIAKIINQTYSSSDHTIANLTGGTLLLAGNSNLGKNNLNGTLSNGTGTISADGTVDASGGDMSGNDMSGNDMSGNDMSGNGMSGNGMSGNDMSGNGMSGNGMSGGTGGGSTDVPAPGSFGMGLLALAGIGGLVATRRRQGRGSDLAV